VNLTEEVDLSIIDASIEELVEKMTVWRHKRASGYVSSEDRKYL
jgi:hypothetical protein